MNADRFSRLEQRIEHLVEGSFARLFDNRLQPREVAVKLAHAVEDNAQPATPESANEQWLAPGLFVITFNPDDLAALLHLQPNLAGLLAETVVDLANRAELRLDSMPIMHLQSSAEVAPRDIQITARVDGDQSRSTQMLLSVPEQAPRVETKPHNPQLILNGTVYIPLERPVINIGRKRDNHVVIEDGRVSRSHAQMRLRFGRYVLYDLGSSGGTYVNTHRITESILRPGDVISLAGVTLVYIEDESPAKLPSDTQVRAPAARKKAVLPPDEPTP